MQLRLNATDDPVAGEPERVTEGDTEYLKLPVVAGREQIYQYTDQPDAYDYEFLPGDELATGVSRANGGLDILLDHPVAQAPSGPAPTLVENAASGARIADAEYRDMRMDSSETKVRGNLLLPVESRTAYGPAYTEAFDTLEDGGTWPVSLGYNVGEIDPAPGRHNGQQYEAVQRRPALDHLALVMNGRARCSPPACAAGRANAEQDGNAASSAAFGEPVTAETMSNQHLPEQDKNRIAAVFETLGSAFGIGVETTPRVNARSSARTPEYDATLAEDDMGPDEYVSTHWVLSDYIDAYAEQTDEEVPADVHSALSDGISQDAREWIAAHTLLGNADAETEPNLLLFDVVSPDGVLHESKLHDVLGEDGARATLPDELREAARDEAGRLLDEEFGDGDGGDTDGQDDTGDADRENATQYNPPTKVTYDGGKNGVVVDVRTSPFNWPDADSEEREASDDEPLYIVARQSGGTKPFPASELSKGWDGDEPDDADPAALGRTNAVPGWYGELDDPNDGDELATARQNASTNIPGVNEKVGFDRLPPNWSRLTLLDAWTSMGGTFRGCRREVAGEVRNPNALCAAMKDSVWGSTSWRRFNAATTDEQDESRAGESGRGTDTTQELPMQDPETPDDPTDEQKIDYLVDEANLDRENMEPLAGTDCLGDIYQRFNSAEAEAGADDDAETETADTPDETDDETDTVTADDNEPAVTFDTEDEFKEAVADVVDERENAQQQESLIDWIDSRSERYNAEMLEGTPETVLSEIADDVAEESRENATFGGMGQPAPPQQQADRGPMRTNGPVRVNADAGEDGPDAAVGGDPWTSGSRENADTEQEADD